MNHIIDSLNSVSLLELSLLLVFIILAILLVYIQCKKDALDLRWLILDETTKQPSIHKIGQGLALAVSTWGFIELTLKGSLTEFYFTGYISVWVGSVAIDKFLANKDGK